MFQEPQLYHPYQNNVMGGTVEALYRLSIDTSNHDIDKGINTTDQN
jgi:hypothetical protein